MEDLLLPRLSWDNHRNMRNMQILGKHQSQIWEQSAEIRAYVKVQELRPNDLHLSDHKTKMLDTSDRRQDAS